MSIFSTIMNKVFHHNAAPAASPTATPAAAPQAAPQAAPTAKQPAQTMPQQSVDVGAVLSEMASMKDGGGNYQSSIVDLLKLLDLDSSLTARKELAAELNVHAAADGSAE